MEESTSTSAEPVPESAQPSAGPQDTQTVLAYLLQLMDHHAKVMNTLINEVHEIKVDSTLHKHSNSAQLESNLPMPPRTVDAHPRGRRDSFLPLKRAAKQLEFSSDEGEDGEDVDDLLEAEAVTQGEDTKPRRRSLAGELAVFKATPSRSAVRMTQQQPDYSDIKLEELTFASVVRFLDRVREYQHKYGVALPVTTMFSTRVKESLLAKYPKHLKLDTYYETEPATIFKILQRVIRPTDRSIFLDVLDKNAYFGSVPQGYVPSAGNFRFFYETLLLYRARFERVYGMLAADNTSNIPRCENKNGGLIKVFLDKIPFEYGHTLHSTLAPAKYRDILAYLDAFFEAAESDHKRSLRSAQLQSHFKLPSSPADAWKRSAKPLSVTPTSKFSTPRMGTPRTPFAKHTHKVKSVIRQPTVDFDSDVDESELRQQWGLDSEDCPEEEAEDRFPPDNDDWQTDSDAELDAALAVEMRTDPSTNLDRISFVAAPPAKTMDKHKLLKGAATTPGACHRMVFHGECDKQGQGCKYSHDMRDIRAKYLEMTSLLEKSPIKQKIATNLRHGPTVSSDKQHTVARIASPTAPDSRLVRERWHVDDKDVDSYLQHVVHRDNVEAAICGAVYNSGTLTLPDAPPITLSRILFDSGATNGSYISKHIVEKYSKVFKPVLKQTAVAVHLAADCGDAPISLKEECDVTLSIRDSTGHVHEATVTMHVFPTHLDTDAILGITDMLTHFPSLYFDMLNSAVNRLAKLPARVSSVDAVCPVATIVTAHVDVASVTKGSIPTADTRVGDNSLTLPLEPPQSVLVSPLTRVLDYDPHNIVDLQSPWSADIAAEAPEDIDTPLPSSFPDILHFMEMTPDEAVQEYISQFDTHVAKGFAEQTSIYTLLRGKGEQVFIPRNWEGITGIPPLDLDWKPGLPERMKPRARPVNPKLWEHAQKEFQRLLGYFYKESSSPIASCLVIAPKATPPFIRFCGDYVAINKYINIGHQPIPHVQKALEKITSFKVFLDFDLVNAFHQIRLSKATSERLSVQTPWMQVEPLFMPEGIGPASGYLQKVVSDIFKECEPWTISIFDNLLVLATDYQDAYNKVEIILDICIRRNVYLKFAKTWLGFDTVNFFGYVCRHGSYELSADRKAAIMKMKFPQSLKTMQVFLGTALFFKSFVPNYSAMTAPLNDMIRSDFNWKDKSTWTTDYEQIFEDFKLHLQDACALYYPDYSLRWILRTDASLRGVGAVLMQVAHPDPLHSPVLQPIAFASQKFSEQASRWTTLEQEGFAVYFAVKSFSYYLTCKDFILETDHNNLLWMEASAVPKVIRWRAYLQGFTFLLRHIQGRLNTLSDWLSRMEEEDQDDDHDHSRAPDRISEMHLGPVPPLITLLPGSVVPARATRRTTRTSTDVVKDTKDNPQALEQQKSLPPVLDTAPPQALVQEEEQVESLRDPAPLSQSQVVAKLHDTDLVIGKVHGGRMGHQGARRTWLLLNEAFPGHRIPYNLVVDFVSRCPACQKYRFGLVDTIDPVVKTLKPPHHRSTIGMDTLTVTPIDKHGHKYILVVSNHMTKFVYLYPLAHHDAVSVAQSLFHYLCTFGLVDNIQTDPGSEFDNEVIRHLTKWFGIRHTFSLVDRHESNGVEGTNKQILRHLSLLVHDERLRDDWSSPSVLPLIQHMLNSTYNSEVGAIPLHCHFGSSDETYLKLPETLKDTHRVAEYVRLLNANLSRVRDVVRTYQQQLVQRRVSKTPPATQNIYSPGDLILHDAIAGTGTKPDKLSPRFTGPYLVHRQVGNDVTGSHVNLGHTKTFHVTTVKIFHGTMDAAKHVALVDQNQYVLDTIIGFQGNPKSRSTMSFLARFQDGEEVWLPWSRDISDTQQFETFCSKVPGLQLLLLSADDAKKRWRSLAKTLPHAAQSGQQCYIDLRSYGYKWYNKYVASVLPNPHTTTYLIPHTYGEVVPDKHRNKIALRCDLFRETYVVDGAYTTIHGSRTAPPNSAAEVMPVVLVDAALVRQYPIIVNKSA